MKIGDLVTRKSYGNDINFIIIDIINDNAILAGSDYRLLADAPLSDLEHAHTRDESLKKALRGKNFNDWYKRKFIIRSGGRPNTDSVLAGKNCGTVLHIDGDPFYLKLCMEKYKKLSVAAVGVNIEESKQPVAVLGLLKKYNPNILVITGHDSLKKNKRNSMNINDYKNSKYFVECVKKAREYNPNYDELIIIAGGCKSHYEALMKAGANFASSPDRIFINITDPVYVASKFASTSIKSVISADAVAKNVISGFSGMGGLETRGQCREVKPKY